MTSLYQIQQPVRSGGTPDPTGRRLGSFPRRRAGTKACRARHSPARTSHGWESECRRRARRDPL